MKENLKDIFRQHKVSSNGSLYQDIELFISKISEQEQSNKIYRKIFHESKTVNLLINPDNGQIEEANQSACNFYGFPMQKLLSKNISEINTLPSDEVKKEMTKARLQKRNHFHFKHQIKTGEVRDVEVYSTPLDFNGKKMLHSTIFDITEKTNAQQQINRLSKAVEQSPATIVITDLDAKIEYVNPRFTELTGYTAQEVIGKNPSILQSGKTSTATYTNMWNTLLQDKVWKGEFVNQRKNGDIFWEQATMSPIYDQNNHRTGFIAIKEDITAKKKANAKLKELNLELQTKIEELNTAYEELNVINEKLHQTNSTLHNEREQFLSLLNSIPEPAYVSDANSYEILFANHTVNEIVGHDITGEKCYKAIQNNSEPCEFCKHKIIFDNGDKPYFWEHYNKNLKKHFYIIERSIKWTDGRDAHFQLAIDISKLKETEIKLHEIKTEIARRNEELAELNATKDKFFSIIAHDLKNPFNSILGFAQFLYEKIEKYDQQTIKEYAYQIYESSRNSYKLLQNLLEWSRAQMGRLEFKPVLFNLYDLTDEAIASLYSQAKSKNIHFDINVDFSYNLQADRNMVATILRNLISNAIKYSYQEGQIQIGATKNEHHIKIWVQDFGQGIPETTQKKLFKISEKVTTPGTEKEKGTGLGLLLVKEFAEKHKGTISIESEKGKGSKFTLELPLTAS